MRVISKKILREFWQKHHDYEDEHYDDRILILNVKNEALPENLSTFSRWFGC